MSRTLYFIFFCVCVILSVWFAEKLASSKSSMVGSLSWHVLTTNISTIPWQACRQNSATFPLHPAYTIYKSKLLRWISFVNDFLPGGSDWLISLIYRLTFTGSTGFLSMTKQPFFWIMSWSEIRCTISKNIGALRFCLTWFSGMNNLSP